MTIMVSRVSSPPYKLVQNTDIKQLAFTEAVKVAGTLSSYLFGVNMRVRSTRAKDVLGWVPREKKVSDGMNEMLEAYFKGKRDASEMKELDSTYKL